MSKVLALALVALLLLGGAPGIAQAGSAAADVALGLASFALFTHLVGWYAHPAYAERVVVYAPPPTYITPQVVYRSRPLVFAAPPPTVVEYPHGRYELRGDGVRTAYHWVWIPRIPPPPPPPDGPTPR